MPSNLAGCSKRICLPDMNGASVPHYSKSIRQLEAEGLEFLRLASILAVAPIPVNFASEVFELLGVGGTAKRYSLEAVNQVQALSLCERSGEEARIVHTLVSRTMRFQFPEEERTIKLRSAAVQALTQRLARIRHIGEYSEIATEMPHARHLVTINLQTEMEAKLGLWVAHRDYERADCSSARQLQQYVLAATRQLLGHRHPDTLTAMNNLALTLSINDPPFD